MRRNKQTIAIILGMLLAIPLGLFIIPRMFAVLLSAGPVQVTVDSPDPLPSSLPYGQSITLSGRLINTGGGTGMSVFGIEPALIKPVRVVPIPDGDFQLSKELKQPLPLPLPSPQQPKPPLPPLPPPDKESPLPFPIVPIPVVTTTAAKTAVSPQTAVATTKTTIATATTTTALTTTSTTRTTATQSPSIPSSVKLELTPAEPPRVAVYSYGESPSVTYYCKWTATVTVNPPPPRDGWRVYIIWGDGTEDRGVMTSSTYSATHYYVRPEPARGVVTYYVNAIVEGVQASVSGGPVNLASSCPPTGSTTTTTRNPLELMLTVTDASRSGDKYKVTVNVCVIGGSPPYELHVNFGDGGPERISHPDQIVPCLPHYGYYSSGRVYIFTATAIDSANNRVTKSLRIDLLEPGKIVIGERTTPVEGVYCINDPKGQHRFVVEYANSFGLPYCDTGWSSFSGQIPQGTLIVDFQIGNRQVFRGELKASVSWSHQFSPSYWGDSSIGFYVEYCQITVSRGEKIVSQAVRVTTLDFRGSCGKNSASVSFNLLFGKIVDVTYPKALPYNRTPGSSYPLSFGVVNLAAKPLTFRISVPSVNVGIDTGPFTLSPGEKRTFSYNVPAHHLLSGFTLALEAYDGGSRIGALWIDQVNVKSSDQPNPWVHPQVTVTINGRVKPYGENYRPASGTVVKIWWDEEERGATTFTRKEVTVTPGNDGSFSKTITMNFMAANGGVKNEIILHMDIMPNQYYESEGGAHVTIYNVNGASQTISPTIYVRKAGGGVITAPSIFQPQMSALLKSYRVLPPGWVSAEVTVEVTIINQGPGSGSGRIIISHATVGHSPPLNYRPVNMEITVGPNERKTVEATAIVGVDTYVSGGKVTRVRGAVGVSFLYNEPESGVPKEIGQLLTFEDSPGSSGSSTSINPPPTTSSTGASLTSSGNVPPGDRTVNTPSGSQINPIAFTEDRTTASYQLTAQGDKATATFDFGQTAPSTITQTPSGGISATGTAVFSATKEPAKNILQQIVDAILGFFRWLDEILFGWMK